MAIYEDYVLVGAVKDDDNGEDSGAAYVFQRSGENWTQVAKLVPSDGAAGDHAGYNVDLYENIAVVCAEFDDDMGETSGSVYVFERSGTTWKEVEKHVPPGLGNGQRFGHDLKLFENTMMVGAFGVNNGQGAVYVYDLSTPVEQIAHPNDSFELYPNPAGREVVISGLNSQNIRFVNLYDQLGRLLQRLPLSDNMLDVSRLAPGLYYVGLEVDRTMALKKLMVR